MELDDLKSAWTELSLKLDRVLSLNLKELNAATRIRARTSLRRYTRLRVRELVVCNILIYGLIVYAVHRWAQPALMVPALVLVLLYTVGAIGTVSQLIALGKINYAGPVTDIQKSLSRIQLHMLFVLRFSMLQLPLYPVYIIIGFDLLFGVNIYRQAPPAYMFSNVAFGMLLIFPAIWIYRRLSPANVDHPVVRLMSKNGGPDLLAASEFFNQLDEFGGEDEGAQAAARTV
jgi:hypothetical protein